MKGIEQLGVKPEGLFEAQFGFTEALSQRDRQTTGQARLGKIRLQFKRTAAGSISLPQIELPPGEVGVELGIVAGHTRMGDGVVQIDFTRLVEHQRRLLKSGTPQLVEMPATSQVVVVCLDIIRMQLTRSPSTQDHSDCFHNCLRNSVRELEYIHHFAVTAFRPKLISVHHLNQLGGDPQLVERHIFGRQTALDSNATATVQLREFKDEIARQKHPSLESKMIREIGLSAPSIAKNEKSEFAFQTRSLTSLYQRVLSTKPIVDGAWKVLVEVLPDVACPKPRNLLGVLAVQVSGRPNDLLQAEDDAKSEMALQWLMCGLDALTNEVAMDASVFHSAAEAVRRLNYINSYIWKKPVLSPDRDKVGELIVEHGIHEAKIFGRVLMTDGQFLGQQLLITARPDELCFVPLLGKLVWIDNSVMELTSKYSDKKWRFSANSHAN